MKSWGYFKIAMLDQIPIYLAILPGSIFLTENIVNLPISKYHVEKEVEPESTEEEKRGNQSPNL